MKTDRRNFLKKAGGASALLAVLGAGACQNEKTEKQAALPAFRSTDFKLNRLLASEMYEKASEMLRTGLRGKEDNPFFKHNYIHLPLGGKNLSLSDFCRSVPALKYHIEELSVLQTLDYFYLLQDESGFICREYDEKGTALWNKTHPVSVGPPLLAHAELEIYGKTRSTSRLESVYPKLRKYFEFMVRNFRAADGLFFGDPTTCGLPGVNRRPFVSEKGLAGGLRYEKIGDEFPDYDGPNSLWNRQARYIDVSAQMALFARHMREIATYSRQLKDIPEYEEMYVGLRKKINRFSWNEEAGFYFDLGNDTQIPRFHAGAYWMLMAKIVPEDRMKAFVSRLSEPEKFGRPVPVPSVSADSPGYKAYGADGQMDPATTYMIIKGLHQYGGVYEDLARQLARRAYEAVAETYVKTGTFWSAYSPEFHSYAAGAYPATGPGLLFPIAVYQEYIRDYLGE